jgi:hypothetical protein
MILRCTRFQSGGPSDTAKCYDHMYGNGCCLSTFWCTSGGRTQAITRSSSFRSASRICFCMQHVSAMTKAFIDHSVLQL